MKSFVMQDDILYFVSDKYNDIIEFKETKEEAEETFYRWVEDVSESIGIDSSYFDCDSILDTALEYIEIGKCIAIKDFEFDTDVVFDDYDYFPEELEIIN